MPTLTSSTLRRHACRAGAFLVVAYVSIGTAAAQVFNGGGLTAGTNYGSGLGGISQSTDLRESILNVMKSVLNFMTLIAVGSVMIAGIYLIVSLGNDDNRDKAKKAIQYTLIGLVVILLCRVIVGLVTEYLKSKVA